MVDRKKRLERNQLFQFAAEIIKKVNNPYKRDVDLAYKKLTSPAGNVAIAHLLKEIVGNMLAAKDRMFFELVQNADDAASQKGVHIKVKTAGDFLIISHNGVSFDKDDFDAIVSAANGTKKTDENKTGYKGIGFKTVFKEANRVFIKTGGYQFKFDKSDARFTDFDSFYFFVNELRTKEQQQYFLTNCVDERNRFKGVEDIPWQLEPIWVDVFPKELGHFFTKSNVAIALEIGKQKIIEKDGYCQAIEEIITNPKFMLFLRNTNRIDFNDKSISKSVRDGEIILKNSFNENRLEYYKIFDYKVKISAIEERKLGFRQNIIEQNDEGKIIDANFIDDANKIIDNIPSKIALNESTTISFAIPINTDKNGAFKPNETDISIFAFLPTLVKEFDFSVFINANFLLTPDRQHILGDNPWNFFLMDELAFKLVDLAANLCLKGDYSALRVLKAEYFDYRTPDLRQLAEHFNSAYKTALESEAFILNHKGELAKQNEIIIDNTGLSGIVGADLFCQLLDTEKCLPSERIDCKILEEDIFEHIETLKFDDIIETITNSSDINDWFISATEEQKKALYKLIDKSNIKAREDKLRSFVSNLPLFQFGEEYKSYAEIDFSECIITTERIEPITKILSKLCFICSNNLFDKNHPLYEFVDLQKEEELFDTIKESDFSKLTVDERKSLFLALVNFKGVGEATLMKGIALFKNVNGDFKPLGEMISYRTNSPEWLNSYIICQEDYSEDIAKYLIDKDVEFEDIIWKNKDKYGISIVDLYSKYPWTDEKYTRMLIKEYKEKNEYRDLLPLIENSGKETQKCYLTSLNKIDLFEGNIYKKESFEFRILQLALGVYETPSDFSPKLFYEGKCVKEFSVKDDIVCDYPQDGETKKVTLSLSKILPQYRNVSDSLNKIKNLFENGIDLDIFFDASPKSFYEIQNELNKHLNLPEREFPKWVNRGNASQYLFVIYYRRKRRGWFGSYVPVVELCNENDDFVFELLDILYDNKVFIKGSPFSCLDINFTGQFFDCKYSSESEHLLPSIEKWANDEKKKDYLVHNGVKTTISLSIKFRQLFLENMPIDFVEEMSDYEIASSIAYIAKADCIKRPFVGKNQITILTSLKEKECCNLSDNWDEKRMEENSKEWDSPQYNDWIKNHYPKIYLYPSFLPSNLSYKSELLINYEDVDNFYYYNKEAKKLFVSKERKIEDILFEIAKEGKSDLGLDDYKFLCLDKILVSQENIEEKDKTIKSLTESNEKKDELIAELQAKLKQFEKDDFGRDGTVKVSGSDNTSLPKLSQYEAQVEAQKRLMQEHLNWEFPTGYGEWDNKTQKPYHFSTVEVKDDKNNVLYIVLKSYKKKESFKINPEEWDWIQNGAQLLIYDGKNIVPHKKEDLIRNQSNISITFSTENLDIEDKISVFSETLHYFKELHFDFDSFKVSDMRNMYNTIDVKQNSISDEEGL